MKTTLILQLLPDAETADGEFMAMLRRSGIGVLARHLGAQVSKKAYAEPIGAVPCRVTVF